MFEAPVDKQESKMTQERIGISIVVLLVIAGIVYFVMSKQSAKPPAAAAAAAPTAPADPVHDLKIVRATMNKDPMGTTAVWLVTLQNKSTAYTYSNIRYESNYIGPDDKSLLVNQGSIPGAFDPGEERNSEIRDTLYPNGTAWYKFKILDAKASLH
ncbi:MAG TPA: hypothetical protein VJX70_11430 [Candidatus Acidoferrum sp.]|nr:hypothetical protein [Candidatus Acidoferrum sp.]